MRKSIFLQIFFLAVSFQVQGQVANHRGAAGTLNRKVTILIEQLNNIKDTVSYYNTVEKVVRTAILCGQYDSLTDSQGKEKNKFRNENLKRLVSIRENIVDAGIYYLNHFNNKEALRYFEFYIDTADNPLFNKQSSRLGQASYNASLLAYEMGKYEKADHYADIALHDDDYAKDAAEVKVNCMRQDMHTHTDSLKYLIALLELHDKAPHNQNYWRMLIAYFQTPGHHKELWQFADDETRKYPDSKYVWGLKGETEMNDHNWGEAISAFKHATEIDSTFVPAIYNIGISYSSQVKEKKDSLMKVDKQLSKENKESLKENLLIAKDYFEKSMRIDPKQKSVDWATPLYQVYYALGDERAEEIKKLIKN